MALGSFRDLLIEVARDPAMLFWLDGRLNTRQRPQENFGREIMELFTFGIGHYNELDVYAAARVFTGWNVRLINRGNDANSYYEFVFNANQHDTGAKTFTFPIYRDGSTTIPARAAADGMQDGIDFITALATHPDTGRRLARKLWNFFVSEVVEPDESTLSAAASAYLQSGTQIESLVHFMLRSRQFQNPGNWHTRYSWPVEFVVRAVKEVGWTGLLRRHAARAADGDGSDTVRAAGRQRMGSWPRLVHDGRHAGANEFRGRRSRATSVSTSRARSPGPRSSPESVLDFFLDRLSPAPFDAERAERVADVPRGRRLPWTGSDAQLRTKAAGLARLIVGSAIPVSR